MIFLLKPILVSCFVSAFFLLLRLRLPSPLGLRLSFLALPLGFCLGLSLIPEGIRFPPDEGFHWVFVASLIAGAWPFLFLSGEPFTFRTFFIRLFVLSLLTHFFSFWFFSPSFFSLNGVQILIWFVVTFLATFFWMFSEKVLSPRLFPVASFLTSSFLSVFFLFSGSLRLAQMMGCLSAVLGVAALWNVLFFFSPVGLSVLPFVTMVFLAFLIPHDHLTMFPFSVFFLMSPFWIGGLFVFVKKKWPLWLQSLLLLIFSLPFSIYVLYQAFTG